MTNPGVGMPCPVCRVPLTMSERQGVEIDYCPQCRGVWLDRGELDKIVERAAREAAPAAPPPPPPQQQAWGHGHAPPPAPAPGYDHGHRHPGGYGHGHGYPKRRKSFLEELFD